MYKHRAITEEVGIQRISSECLEVVVGRQGLVSGYFKRSIHPLIHLFVHSFSACQPACLAVWLFLPAAPHTGAYTCALMWRSLVARWHCSPAISFEIVPCFLG